MTKCGLEVARVGVDEEHQVAAYGASARHIASPLPSTGPSSGSSSVCWRTSAPARAATSALPSSESASTTSTWSTRPSSASIRSTIAPTVSATSRAGSTTDSVARLRSSSSSSGKSACSKELITPRVLWRTVAVTREQMPWEPILDRGEGEQLVARSQGTRPGRAHRADPREPAPRAARGARARRAREPLRPPGRRAGVGLRGRHDRDHRHRQRQVAGVQPAGARHARPRPLGARALPLPHQGAGPGPGARAARAQAAGSCAPRSTTATRPREERRAIRAKLEPDPHQPRHAARGRAAQPPPWGDLLANLAWIVVDEAHVYRGVFGSHVANVLRRLRRAGARLRHRAALRAGQRDDRQPGGAGRAAHRLRRGAGGPRRRAARRAPDRHVEPAAHRRAHGRARVAAGRGGRPAGRPGGEGGAHDLLPALAPGRGADPALHAPAPGGPRAGRPGRADRALPRRLHARPAARDRAAAGGRRAAGRGGHRRPGAGHRRRRPGRGDLRDVPRHGGQPAPDVGPRGAARHRAWRCTWRAPTPSTSSSAATPRSSSSAPWSRRSSTTSPRRSTWPTSRPPPTSCRSRAGDEEFLGDGWEPAAERLVALGELRERGGRYLPARRGLPRRRRSRCAPRRPTRWRSWRARRAR